MSTALSMLKTQLALRDKHSFGVIHPLQFQCCKPVMYLLQACGSAVNSVIHISGKQHNMVRRTQDHKCLNSPHAHLESPTFELPVCKLTCIHDDHLLVMSNITYSVVLMCPPVCEAGEVLAALGTNMLIAYFTAVITCFLTTSELLKCLLITFPAS